MSFFDLLTNAVEGQTTQTTTNPKNWRDKFVQGSFRGVTFKTESHEFGGGRRSQVHEFPSKERSRVEDLGRRIREFSFDCLVIGDDYFTQRDTLIEALEADGPGELIHPYLGKKLVQVDTFSMRETVADGRMARFTISFIETSEIVYPQSVEDQAQNAIDNALATLTASKNFFEQTFDIINQTATVITDASEKLNAFADFMEASVKKFTEPIANLTYAIRNFKADLAALMRLPGELADRIQSIFSDLFDALDTSPDIRDKVLGFFENYGEDFVVIIANTPSRQKIQGNADAIVGLVKTSAFAKRAEGAIDIQFVSNRAAVEKRDEIFDQLEVQAEAATDDELFQAIKDLQGSITLALPPSGLGEIVTFTPMKTLPALVVAYDLFEDLDKETEIIDQNKISHPGFLKAGETIEVASV